ncbi:MAG TPA: hypothetical protein VGG11_13740 [Xanthobacteraceae bacterium]|jgi:hypothetical protein
MIDYDLAKQLKEAGFPQETKAGYILDGICYPTLEELIEACGDKFGSLHAVFDGRRGDTYGTIFGWQAVGAGRACPDMSEPTPTVAVARLWLALNVK